MARGSETALRRASVGEGADTAAGWITCLPPAHSTGGLNALLTKLSRYHLLIVDEVGDVWA